MDATPRIVAGIDDSEHSREILGFARREAAERGAQIEVVWAWGPGEVPPPEWEARLDPYAVQSWAQAQLEERIAEVMPADLRVIARAVNDDPATALVDASERAELLVVGARGRGGFLGLRLGSVSGKVLGRTACPVAVVRPVTARAAAGRLPPIVVGVDGSPHARHALHWAVGEAGRRGVDVCALHGWSPPRVLSGTYPKAYPPGEIYEKGARRLVDEAVDAVRTQAGEVKVTGRVVCASGAHALIAESTDASLVVVGTRGRGGLAGLAVGSVSAQVSHHAECPVVVVPRS